MDRVACRCGGYVVAVLVGLAIWMPGVSVAGGWSAERIAVPGGAAVKLAGVSCSSPSDCMVVGSGNRAEEGMVARRWSGKRWAFQQPLGPIGTSSAAGLTAVSCPTSSACIAVGTWKPTGVDAMGTGALVERWNGKRWSAQPIPAGLPDLNSVSCVSPNACMAVGDTGALRWNGRRWSILSTPNDVQRDIQLTGVSCGSPTAYRTVARSIRPDPPRLRSRRLAHLPRGGRCPCRRAHRQQERALGCLTPRADSLDDGSTHQSGGVPR
jgi:hypothetical protein